MLTSGGDHKPKCVSVPQVVNVLVAGVRLEQSFLAHSKYSSGSISLSYPQQGGSALKADT
jgi:hypothetical protein